SSGNQAVAIGIAGLLISGGGILVSEGTLGIYGSTIVGNSASSEELGDRTFGGGIQKDGKITLANSAVIANATTRVGSGGGIWNVGTMSIRTPRSVGTCQRARAEESGTRAS